MHWQWNIWIIRKEGETMGDAIISVEELSKSFGQHEVLRKIDFNVEPGEIICIVGSSGSAFAANTGTKIAQSSTNAAEIKPIFFFI